MNRQSSKIIEAIANYCQAYANDPNLFPPKQDKDIRIIGNVPVISEHRECGTDDLELIAMTKYTQGNVINA